MGCGISRIERDHDNLRSSSTASSGATYLYINPLHRRIEEFGGRRRGGHRTPVHSPFSPLSPSDDSPSTKKLLPRPSAVADDDISSGLHDISVDPFDDLPNNNIGCHNDVLVLMKEPPAMQVMKATDQDNGDREEGIKEAKEIAVTKGGEGNSNDDMRKRKEEEESTEEEEEEEEEEVVLVKKAVAEKGRVDDDKEGRAEDEEHHVESGISDRGGSILLYPGSPSFREYCISEWDGSGDSYKTNGERPNIMKGENESNKGSDVPSSDSDQVTRDQMQTVKKTKKRRRFGRVLTRGTNGSGMKNLWHVSSCSPSRRSFRKTPSC